MALHRKGKRPPNPDPDSYIWINTKEGGFWHKKRGLVKKAVLNAAYRQSSEYIKICSPAASRIVRKLRPFMEGLQPGRITARICGKLRKSLNETGRLSMQCLNGLDLQPEYPLVNLLTENIHVEQKSKSIIVTIPITPYTIKRMNNLVTDYWFELILLYGNPDEENGLRTESEESKPYAIKTPDKNGCSLSLVLSEQPWIALLKVNCIEGNEPAIHPKMYGMKVVAVGG
ncbi:MAG TPA: hypothetical protein VFW07_09375 [Parafilimonas sp.]|nr:hypothetical protein [Parafilimonas sp.]